MSGFFRRPRDLDPMDTVSFGVRYSSFQGPIGSLPNCPPMGPRQIQVKCGRNRFEFPIRCVHLRVHPLTFHGMEEITRRRICLAFEGFLFRGVNARRDRLISVALCVRDHGTRDLDQRVTQEGLHFQRRLHR